MYKIQKKTLAFTIFLYFFCLLNSSFAFDITSVTLYEDDNGATTTSTTTMTPNDEMTLAFTVTAASLKDLSITIYDTSVTTQSACHNTNNPQSADMCAWVEWKNNSGEEIMADIRPTQTTWLMDTANSLITTSSASRFVFTPSKSSHYSDTSSWTIYIKASNATHTKTKSILLNNTYYLQLDVSKSSVGFEPGRKNTQNHPLTDLKSNGYDLTYIPLTIISNAPYSWKAKSTDFSGGSTIDVDNNTLGYAFTNTVQSKTSLNTTYTDLEISHSSTTDSGDPKQLFLWLNYPIDPDVIYTATLSIEAYITANPSQSTPVATVSMNATTDNTKPSIIIETPASLSWTKTGDTVSYLINLTDTRSGFMNPLEKILCDVYLGGTKLSEVYFTKDPLYNQGICSGTFQMPETTDNNVNLNFTVRDMAQNLAYNDTIWMQVDHSSLYIADVALISTAKPNDLDWYFLPTDIFRITGHIKNQAGDAINSTLESYLSLSGASVTVDSIAVSSSSPFTTNSQGNLDIEYTFTGSNVGDGILYITSTDQMNNTADYNRTFYITNYLEHLRILTNFTGKIYSEGDNISIDIDTNGDLNPVYMADITATMQDPNSNIVQTSNVRTGADGKARFYFDVPKKPSEYYTVHVSGISSLNIDKTISNTTTIDTEWLEVSAEIKTIGYIESNRSTKLDIYGRVDYSDDVGNDTLVEGAKVTCLIKGPNNYNETVTSTVNSTSEYFCDGLKNVTVAGKYRFEISATHTINTFKISGWNKLETITLTNTSEIQSSGQDISQMPNHPLITIIEYPQLIELTPGEKTSTNITIKNTGDSTLKNLIISLSPKDLELENVMIKYTETILELEQNEIALIQINITARNTSGLNDHELNILIESDDGINTSVSFTLHITQGMAEKQRVDEIYLQLKYDISAMRYNLNKLLPSDNENLTFLDTKLKSVELYLHDLKLSIENNNYKEADSLISDIEKKMFNLDKDIKIEVDKKTSNTLNYILVGIILLTIILVSFLLYYMWLPEKSTDSGFKNDINSDSESKETVVEKITEFIEREKHNLQPDSDNPKYDYHKKERWAKS